MERKMMTELTGSRHCGGSPAVGKNPTVHPSPTRWSTGGMLLGHSIPPEYDGGEPAGRERHHGGGEPVQHPMIAGGGGDDLLET